MVYEALEVRMDGSVQVITLNRPKALNALNAQLVQEIVTAFGEAARNDDVHVVLVTGSEKAFAAGADIKEMAEKSYMDVFKDDFFADLQEAIMSVRKPVIAAVSGYALGGGCELAMLCDFVIAADTAKFGQPEVTIGAIPGIGGSQRLTRFVGKSKSMEMCLTGRMMDAEEAERSGLVARVVPAASLLEDAMETASKISEFSMPVVAMVKEVVNRAYETTLQEGLLYERRVFHTVFATEDQKEGMDAFINKRQPNFRNR